MAGLCDDHEGAHHYTHSDGESLEYPARSIMRSGAVRLSTTRRWRTRACRARSAASRRRRGLGLYVRHFSSAPQGRLAQRFLLTEVGLVDDVVESATAPMVLNVVHIEDGGAGCAGGVLGSPWWNVEVPYTPMG